MRNLIKRTVGVILAVAMVFALQVPVFAATTFPYSNLSVGTILNSEDFIYVFGATVTFHFCSAFTSTTDYTLDTAAFINGSLLTNPCTIALTTTLELSKTTKPQWKVVGIDSTNSKYYLLGITPPPVVTPDDTDTSTDKKKDRDKDKDEPTGLIVEVKGEKSAPTTGLQNNDDQVADMVFDAVELRDIGNGASAAVILTIEDVSENVPVIDKILIDNTIKEMNKADNKNKLTLGMYLDISLFKEINNDKRQIHETNGKLKIQIEIPKNLRQNGRNFAIARLHDREFEIITGTYDAKTGMFTFETDRFSTYALVYDDGGEATEVVSENVADFGVEFAVLEE